MIEYMTELKIMNPAAQYNGLMNKPRRKGSFVSLAHAREEFTAPALSKGKSALSASKTSKNEPSDIKTKRRKPSK